MAQINTVESSSPSQSTYKSCKVVVDAVCCQSLAELGFLLQEFVLHLGHLLRRVALVVARHGGKRRLFKRLLRAHKQLLVHVLRGHDVTWQARGGHISG